MAEPGFDPDFGVWVRRHETLLSLKPHARTLKGREAENRVLCDSTLAVSSPRFCEVLEEHVLREAKGSDVRS